jgi:hypothetical protein
MLADLVTILGTVIVEHPTFTRAPLRTVPIIKFIDNRKLFFLRLLSILQKYQYLPSWDRTRACTKPVAGSRTYHSGRSFKGPVDDLIANPVAHPLEQVATESNVTGVVI